MRVWLVTVGEPLPVDKGTVRLFRTGMLAKALVDSGHEVTWWSSTFDHFRKTHRSQETTCVSNADGCRLWLLHGPSYKKSVSFARIRNHRTVARTFRELARGEMPPDVIHCSMPTIELSLAATHYGRTHNVPVVLDIRDLWPDIIVDHAPNCLQSIARIGLDFMFRQLTSACRDATALTAITDGCLEWALGCAGRSRGPLDHAFPLAYTKTSPGRRDLERANRFWRERGIGQSPDQFIVCYFGPISRRYELRDAVKAAGLVDAARPKCQFVICGEGEDLAACKELAKPYGNIMFPGWVGAAEIWTLLRMSKIGIVPHPSTMDYVLSYPNKSIELLSGGLPVVTSLGGALQDLIESEGCGVRYDNGDFGALARIVCELHDDSQKLREMSERASRLFRERFVAETVYQNMVDYLVEVG